MKDCTSCGHAWPLDRFNENTNVCFRCRARSLQFNYGTRGRDGFHDHTVKEFNDRQVAEARANGLDPQPVVTAANPGPTVGSYNRLATALKGK